MTNYNDGKWHGWNSGECPVHPETVVEIRFLNDWNDVGQKNRVAGGLLWEHDGNIGDIIAFRVIKEHKEPREFWLNEVNGKFQSEKCTNGCCIHVREVLE